MIALVGTGLYLTWRLRFVQVRHFCDGLRLLFQHTKAKDRAPGEVSRFAALSTALSGTIGTGNIAGVATAITMGGPGAIFWMWITAIVGMATKFASCTLAVKFRDVDEQGHFSGGPMHTLRNGLNMPKLGAIFAFFTIIATLGTGNAVQANSIVNGLSYVVPQVHDHRLLLGCFLAAFVGVVILGGVKRIATVASFMVPFMTILYCGAAIVILILNVKAIPSVFVQILHLAFTPHAVAGGSMGSALRYGIARGVFSNEAGMGTAAIAHAAVRTNRASQQGFVAMLGPFIDTLVICSMTAFVIIIAGNPNTHGITGASLSSYAFQHGLGELGEFNGHVGAWVVSFSLIFFAYTSIIAWSYYGGRCVNFLLGPRFITPYRILFTLLVIVGAISPLKLVWQIADLSNIFMIIPNLVSLILLTPFLKDLLRRGA